MVCSVAEKTPGIRGHWIINIIDCDCIVFVFAESNELSKEIVVILGGMGFALISARDEEFIMVVVFVYEGLGFRCNGLFSSILC